MLARQEVGAWRRPLSTPRRLNRRSSRCRLPISPKKCRLPFSVSHPAITNLSTLAISLPYALRYAAAGRAAAVLGRGVRDRASRSRTARGYFFCSVALFIPLSRTYRLSLFLGLMPAADRFRQGVARTPACYSWRYTVSVCRLPIQVGGGRSGGGGGRVLVVSSEWAMGGPPPRWAYGDVWGVGLLVVVEAGPPAAASLRGPWSGRRGGGAGGTDFAPGALTEPQTKANAHPGAGEGTPAPPPRRPRTTRAFLGSVPVRVERRGTRRRTLRRGSRRRSRRSFGPSNAGNSGGLGGRDRTRRSGWRSNAANGGLLAFFRSLAFDFRRQTILIHGACFQTARHG